MAVSVIFYTILSNYIKKCGDGRIYNITCNNIVFFSIPSHISTVCIRTLILLNSLCVNHC